MEAPLQVSIRGELCFNENLALEKAWICSFVHCFPLGTLVVAVLRDGGMRRSRKVTCGEVPLFLDIFVEDTEHELV